MPQPAHTTVSSRISLLFTLLGFMLVFVIVGWATAERAEQIAANRQLAADLTDLYAFAFSYVLLFFLLAATPLLMVIGYHGVQGEITSAKLHKHLAMAGLTDQQLSERMREYGQRNGFSAFFLPMLVNALLLHLFWAATLLPHGIDGMLEYLSDGGTLKLGIAFMFPRVAADASLVTWALLGAYFYCLSMLVRRWMQSDLTTGVVWKLNVRIILSFVLGLLLSRMVGGEEVMPDLAPGVVLLAFTIGIVPDVFLRWAARQLKRIGRVEGEAMVRLFEPSDLQKRMPGMTFWQADRLAEESIESVQDLAMRSISTLMIHTRFDAALLMSWVDRALLANQAGEQLPLFQRAHVFSATELLARAASDADRAKLLRSLRETAAWQRGGSEDEGAETPGVAGAVTVSEAQLENIVSGLQNGPNVAELRCFWRASSAHRPRAGRGLGPY